MTQQACSLSCLLLSLIFSLLSPASTSSSLDSFVYSGCSQLRFQPGTPYETNVNSVLTSFLNSASISTFDNFKISLPGSTQGGDAVYGLFQCRDDLSSSGCKDCVARSVSELGVTCAQSTGGAIQLEGCFVKYDNVSFVGVEDKTEVLKRCGLSSSDVLARRDVVLAELTAEDGGYLRRVGGSTRVQGVAQCVHDLSLVQCRDCLLEASQRLTSECGTSAWADMFLGKCYVRYSDRGSHSRTDNNDDDVDKTLAIMIGIIAGVAVVIVFLSLLCSRFGKKGGK